MIDKQALSQFVEQQLHDTDCYIVEIKVSQNNEIEITIDSDSRVDLDECIALTHKIEDAFSRDDEDYSLEVGSAGITSPLKIERQYRKNIGHDIEILCRDGHKFTGTLRSVDSEGFTAMIQVKEKIEGKKRPEVRDEERRFLFSEVNAVVPVLKF